MTEPILPVVGSAGYYELGDPFDKLVVNSVEYTCKAIRRLSDYLANNETPKKDIYDKNGVVESVYDEDLKKDAYIVSLQSRTGHWLYVPYRYILSYPSVNGVQYRSVMIGISLPALPASQDLSSLANDLKDLTQAQLGVTAVVKQVETSKVVLIDFAAHEAKRLQRAGAVQASGSLFGQVVLLRKDNDALRAKVEMLENHIKQMTP